jgi:polyisoprenyl-phosphate glycosyltransferase
MPLVTVIIPAYNEADNLATLYERLASVAANLRGYDFEFLLVDDGSSDATPTVLAGLRALDQRVKCIRFSRNFGSHAACLAGLMATKGDLAVILAADLQDPPELLGQMLDRIEEGYDVVFAVRDQREDVWLTVRLANIYHWLMRRYAIPNWPLHGFDFLMLRRSVLEVIVDWRQKNTSIFAQLLWTGFRQSFVTYTKQRRQAGRSKWTVKKKIKLLTDSFVSFSFAPIRFISYSGLLFSTLGFLYAAFVIFNKIFFGSPIPGWTSLMVAFLCVSGFQLLMLGIIGEYLWRVADEVRSSPPFIIESTLGVNPIPDQATLERGKASLAGLHTNKVHQGSKH